MDLRSKHTAVLAESPSLAKSGLSLPSLASVVPASPLFPYSSSTTLFSPRSALSGSALISRRKILPSKLEDVCALDAMKSASPPRIKSVKGFNLEVDTQGPPDAAYDTWIVKHPSALSMFEQIVNSAKGKKIALFLDYDGTLSPIVDDPDRAYMSDAMRSAVQKVARYFPTAIISGRGRDKVYDFVRLAELYYAGSHGMDIMVPAKSSAGSNGYNVNCTKSTNKKGKEVVLFQPAREFLPMIDEVFKLLVEKTKRIHGAKVENNNFCVSVHFRCVEEKNWSALAEQVRGVLHDYPRLHLTHGRKVLEIRPSIKWDKGKALEFLLDSLGLAKCSDVLPLYVGDDRTDEDAFKVLRGTGHGYGILVSTVPKETNAFYSLRDPSEVMSFLNRLVKWKKLSMKVDVKRKEHCKNLPWNHA